MAAAVLAPGSLERLKEQPDSFPNGVVLRVSDLTAVAGNKHRCTLTDGRASMRGVLASQLADLVSSGELANGCLVRITSYNVNHVGSESVLLATDLVVAAPADGSQPMDADTALTAHNATPEAAKSDGKGFATAVKAMKENSTPAPSPPTDFKGGKTPGPSSMPSPSPLSYAPTPTATPNGGAAKGTPVSLAVSDRKTFHKIAQLHPYETNWCIKAKVERRGPVRTQSIRGQDVHILTIDLVDEEGKQIQGTFWRGAAVRYGEALVEGRVYVFHRFKVKPADRKYSSVKADYQIDFTDSTEVTEAADQAEASSMTAAVEITPIDALPRRVGARAPVDVLGIVLALGAVGTVKRKADNSELPRRDVTLGDSSGKSVVVTLWGENAHATAAQLDGQEGRAVLQVTHVRVTDFNGCSISTLSKSIVTVNPAGSAAAEALRTWYATAGMSPDRFVPVGENLAGARNSNGGAGSSRDRFCSLREVSGVTPDSIEGDKAVFQTLVASVAMVNTDGQMYYLANPENGKKVVDQGGGRYAEADGRVVERAEQRYALSLRLADHTGEAFVQAFNKEAETVLGGVKADDLALLKDGSKDGTQAAQPDAFAAVVRSAQWRPWSVTVMSKAREYNGERRVRHTVHRVEPVDWTAEAGRLVAVIAQYGSA